MSLVKRPESSSLTGESVTRLKTRGDETGDYPFHSQVTRLRITFDHLALEIVVTQRGDDFHPAGFLGDPGNIGRVFTIDREHVVDLDGVPDILGAAVEQVQLGPDLHDLVVLQVAGLLPRRLVGYGVHGGGQQQRHGKKKNQDTFHNPSPCRAVCRSFGVSTAGLPAAAVPSSPAAAKETGRRSQRRSSQFFLAAEKNGTSSLFA